jgi:hypothetical protein
MFLSLEFGNNIKIVEGYKKKNIVYIKKAVTINESVDIKDILKLSDSINEVLIKNNIRTKRAIFIINTESAIIRKIKLPLLNKKSEIITMIKHELGQVVSADLSLYKIIYKIIETHEAEEKATALYAAYCLPLNIYEFYEKLGKKLRLKVVGIDISSNCLNNILEQNIELNNHILDSKDAYAFVNTHFDKILFSVINKGNDFFMISNIERNHGNMVETDHRHDRDDMVIRVEYIYKCCRYYHSVNNKKVNRIYLYGYNSSDGLDKLLSSILNLEVEYINSVSNISIADNISINEYFISLTALYNAKSSFLTKNEKRIQILISFAGASVILFCLLFFLSKHSNSVRKQIAYLDIYIKNEKNIERNLIIEKLKSEIRLLNSAITSIETAMDLVNNENVRTENIKGVYNSLPGNTEVLSFSIDKDSLNMQCISDSMDEVLCLLRNLEGLYFVESVYIPAIQSMKDMKYSYTIICNFKVNYEG